MKDAKTKEKFIIARAEGKSYSTIAKELGISKGTCTSWERELKESIDSEKRGRLEDLYTAYHMTREARIKNLGEILSKIDNAVEEIHLDEITPEKLLSLKLKYEEALKKECTEAHAIETDNTLDGLLEQYNGIYEEAREGKLSASEVSAQLSILSAKKRTIEQISIEERQEENNGFLDPIDAIVYKSKLLRQKDEEDA